ncbi:uncharacterized protein TM35_000181880 [Trypanosoma theileri]|uniref:protein-histidine N-methyltransferase n=1 Tax=Trypanosoma theileri TaxID=67003 RepID=A0A1X0NU45_9TRYP|nr:uncharacterized protein TM35_000181880 [Trypanosoma theileri]ORC88131.1 hypothetical protein TM35_000181880 [Trypanosoma theileri]
MSSEGFRFSFADNETEEVVPGNTDISISMETETALLPLWKFPAFTLSDHLLAEWAAQYPNNPNHRMELVSDGVVNFPPLLYQRAPHVSQLTAGNGQEERDIVPGRYYGGLKVWSCAPYLVEYIFANREIFQKLFLTDDKLCNSASEEQNGENALGESIVAEVGCGQGLPGIAALLLGARRVVFQDYNEEVLELCVKPNIGVNLLRHTSGLELCKKHSLPLPIMVHMVSGDWNSLQWENCVNNNNNNNNNNNREGNTHEYRCKVVLGSDVTFDEEACEKLAAMLKRCLSPENGVAYIASKQYYFGTNGGVLEFQRRAEAHGLEVTEVSRKETVGEMQRSIVQVRKRC